MTLLALSTGDVRQRVNNQLSSAFSFHLPYSRATSHAMSQSGPPADAKQAQVAAIQEIEAAKKKKNAIDSQLVRPPLHSSSPGKSNKQAHIEESIYRFEGSYLDDTAHSGGNIIKVSRHGLMRT